MPRPTQFRDEGGGTPDTDRDTIYSPSYFLTVYPGVKAPGFTVITPDDEIGTFIQSIEFEDNSEQFDSLKIEIQNNSDIVTPSNVLSILDTKVFSAGNIIEVGFGYGGFIRTVGAASIVTRTPTFPEGDVPSVTIEGFDLLHRAARRRPRGGVNYSNFRDSQIASIIGERNGFEISLKDPTSYETIRRVNTKPEQPRIQKAGLSDYEFLKKIADINGFDLFSKFDPDQKRFVLFFRPPKKAKQNKIFDFYWSHDEKHYSDTLLSFEPTEDAHDQGSDFEIFLIRNKKTVRGSFEAFDRYGQKELDILKSEQEGARAGKYSARTAPINEDGVIVGFKAFGRSFRFPSYKRFKTGFQIRREIQTFIDRQRENFITGRGRLIGNAAIQSRQVHNLQGIGRYSGKYYFKKVVHKMDKNEGYFTEFDCVKVIDDLVVQTAPEIQINENDRRVEKFKGETEGNTNSPAFNVFTERERQIIANERKDVGR